MSIANLLVPNNYDIYLSDINTSGNLTVGGNLLVTGFSTQNGIQNNQNMTNAKLFSSALSGFTSSTITSIPALPATLSAAQFCQGMLDVANVVGTLSLPTAAQITAYITTFLPSGPPTGFTFQCILRGPCGAGTILSSPDVNVTLIGGSPQPLINSVIIGFDTRVLWCKFTGPGTYTVI